MRRALASLTILALVVVVLATGCSAGRSSAPAPSASGQTSQPAAQPPAPKVKLTIATHWGAGFQEHLQPYLDEYQKANPNVTIDYQAVPFDEYFKKVQVSHSSGDAPDIYHVYSLWGVQLARSKVIAEAPPEVAKDVKQNFVPAAVNGATIDGKLYGYPTELNNYMLVYNKRLLKEAGYDNPPKTWDEMYEMAKKMTKVKDGKIEQAGVLFMKGWDSAVVHPFMTLLLSNGGQFLSPDNKKALFNSPEGIAALEFQVRFFREKLADPALDVFQAFPAGKVGMVIMAPFFKSTLQKGMGENYKDVGVAPIPAPAGKEWKTTGYTWFWTVDSNSKNKAEAWKFLQWLYSAQSSSKSSRMGDYLVKVGILPSRQGDVDGHGQELGDAFTKPFVDGYKATHLEPNFPQGQEAKTALQREIEAAWLGQKSPKDALDAAAGKVNNILAEAK